MAPWRGLAYNPGCPAWRNLTWPRVGEFNLANGAAGLDAVQDACMKVEHAMTVGA